MRGFLKTIRSIRHTDYEAREVFTPTTPARRNYVERSSIDNKLIDALRTPGKQLIIYGESGSGKSSLLRNKLRQVYAYHIKTQCSAAMSYEQLLLDAFDQLNAYFVQSRSSKESFSISPSVEADFKAISLGVEASMAKGVSAVQKRVLPPQLTPQRLATSLGKLNMCWVVEDFHKIREDEKALYAQSLKIFSDMSDTYRDVKIITIGATETARQVVSYDSEMTKRVSELLVPLMSRDELAQIILQGQDLLHIDMSAIVDDIVDYSVGMPSVCHQIALNVCLVERIERTQRHRTRILRQDLKPAVQRWADELSDTIKASFELANRQSESAEFDNSKLILTVLAAGPVSGMPFDEILEKIQLETPKYPESNLRNYLRELGMATNGGLVRYGTDGRYRFAEPVYHTAAKAALLDLSSRERSETPVVRLSPSHEEVWEPSYIEANVANQFLGRRYSEQGGWNLLGDSVIFTEPPQYFDPNIGTSLVPVPLTTSSTSIGEVSILTFKPTITSAASYTATFGVAFSFTVTASGAPSPTIIMVGKLPPGVKFTWNTNGTARISGTPRGRPNQDYPLALNALNDYGSDTQAFTLTVNSA